MRAIAWFTELHKNDTRIAGGKGANLGELTTSGFKVPEGFVVTTAAYLASMEAAGVRAELRERVAAVDPDDSPAIRELSAQLREIVWRVSLPGDIHEAVATAYGQLGRAALVAVRSSATSEDTEGTSFAGMNETFTNVRGVDDVMRRVRECWASMFGERSVAYRAARGITEEPAIAVVVQRMLAPVASGVMFSVDPITGDRAKMVMEAAFGQGEVVVGGQVEPDTYTVDKAGPAITRVRVGTKSHKIVAGPAGDDVVDLSAEEGASRVLTDEQVLALARVGMSVEAHYGEAQDMEFALDASGDLWLLQSRPVTTLPSPEEVGAPAAGNLPAGPGPLASGLLASGLLASGLLASGLGAVPGIASGKVRVLSSPRDGAELEPGEVLVAPMTNPDWVPAIRRAAAVVTDGGGMTCHAAIVSREMGVPCVVGTGRATTVLWTGQEVTVDGSRGQVFEGMASPAAVPAVAVAPAAPPPATPDTAPTATLVYVNLALAARAGEVAALPVDGVGLLRAELMMTDALGGAHPRKLLADGRRQELVSSMVGSLLHVTRAFDPRPVVYRAVDFRTNEFRGLEGGELFEPVESNPMIGYRGCYRYTQEPELFQAELEILARVREETANLHLMIPFVRTRWELEACLELVDASPLGRQRGLHRWVMAEVPSVVYRIPEYAQMGIDGVSIGSNDLTQLMLGVDRDSGTCSELFDESDAAVLDAIERIVSASRDAGITCSLCGQAPSNKPAFAEHLVRFGITSVSVDPGTALQARAVVARAEHRLIVEAARASR